MEHGMEQNDGAIERSGPDGYGRVTYRHEDSEGEEVFTVYHLDWGDRMRIMDPRECDNTIFISTKLLLAIAKDVQADETAVLKPCPLCGGSAVYRTEWVGNGMGHDTSRICCTQCGLELPGKGSCDPDDECRLTEIWNRRCGR